MKVHALGRMHFVYSEVTERWEAWASCTCGDTFTARARSQPAAQQRVVASHKEHKRIAREALQ